MSTRIGRREALRRHDKQLESHRRGKFLDVLSHSVLGLVDVYNLLPQYVVNATTVSNFQQRLQQLVVVMAKSGDPGWKQIYCPRKPIWDNALRRMSDWSPIATTEKNEGTCHNATRTTALPAWLR